MCRRKWSSAKVWGWRGWFLPDLLRVPRCNQLPVERITLLHFDKDRMKMDCNNVLDCNKKCDPNIIFWSKFEPVQMVEGLPKVAIDALPNHRWIEVLAEEEKLWREVVLVAFQTWCPCGHSRRRGRGCRAWCGSCRRRTRTSSSSGRQTSARPSWSCCCLVQSGSTYHCRSLSPFWTRMLLSTCKKTFASLKSVQVRGPVTSPKLPVSPARLSALEWLLFRLLYTYPFIVLLCGQIHCEDEVKVVVGYVAALRGQHLKIVVVMSWLII